MTKMAFTPAAGVIVTPDDVSHPKPDPESLVLACKTLQCPPANTIFVGDHRRDIEAGVAAGCKTIAASYGYLAMGESAEEWGADAIASSSQELRTIIEELLA
jgi:phosphoglycolate phosphatase-like HAD superfamily hydrolase